MPMLFLPRLECSRRTCTPRHGRHDAARGEPPHGVAPLGVLDLDDLGAPVGQDRRRGRDEGVLGHLEDANTFHDVWQRGSLPSSDTRRCSVPRGVDSSRRIGCVGDAWRATSGVRGPRPSPGRAPCRHRSGRGTGRSRAHGSATASPGATGNVGPAKPAQTPAIDTSRSQRPPSASASRQAPAAVSPVRGSATASAQNIGAVLVPHDEAARRGGVVAEGDPLGRVTAAPVAGDGDPHLRPIRAHDLGRADPELFEGAGPARLDHDVGPRHQGAEPAPPSGLPKSSATDRFRPFSRSKNGRGPRRAPSGRVVDSTLTTVAPAPARQVAAEGPGPQRGQVDDQAAGRDPRRSPIRVGTRRHGPVTRSPRRHAPRADRAARPAPSARRRRAGRRARPRRTQVAAPSSGATGELEPGRHDLHVVRPRQGHGHPAPAAGQQTAAAASSWSCRAATDPSSAARSPSTARRVESAKGSSEPLDPLDQAARAGRAAGRAAPSAPWRRWPPSAAPGGSSTAQGNVSRFSNSSAPTHSSPSCAATSRPSAAVPCGSCSMTMRSGDDPGRPAWPACPSSSSA